MDGYTASYNPENQLVTVTADDLWAAPDNNNMTTFDNVKTYPVTITNTFVAVSALPMTGGATTRDWLVYGGGFGLLAALVRIGYFIWRKRRLSSLVGEGTRGRRPVAPPDNSRFADCGSLNDCRFRSCNKQNNERKRSFS